MKLTDTLIRNAKPADKPRKLPREDGLFVLITPSGGKWWRFSYRYGGREKTLSFGTYPDVPLALARERRDEARRLVAAGTDPSEQRRENRMLAAAAALNSFNAVVERWTTDELAANSDEYAKSVSRMLERDVLPYLGPRPMADIKSRDLIVVFDRIRERGVEETARRARAIVGQTFRFAIRKGVLDYDPTQALRGQRRLQPVEHFAALTEPDDVARLIRAITVGNPGVSSLCDVM